LRAVQLAWFGVFGNARTPTALCCAGLKTGEVQAGPGESNRGQENQEALAAITALNGREING
jgi:hypothetical protein